MADNFIRSLNGYKLKDETAREQIATLQTSFDSHNHDDSYETKTDATAKLTEAKSYADTQIAALVNAAPETLDTLGELASAFQENEEVVAALDAAITTKADKSDVAIADWSVNDPSSPAYIVNRTHWVGDPYDEFLVSDVQVDVEEANVEIQNPFSAALVNGETYKVTFNGEQYERVATSYNGYDVYIGNNAILGWNDGADTGEPFFMSYYAPDDYSAFATSESGTHTISISHVVSEIHKIDSKFLPELPAGASIGKAGEGVGSEIFNYYGEDDSVSTFMVPPQQTQTSNIASGDYSHAEGYFTRATGVYSHAEGNDTEAGGANSHTEGNGTSATGNSSHAEGFECSAVGDYSHAEGNGTFAGIGSSHAEGDGTNAGGYASHAEGMHTWARGEAQHVQGKYNISDGYEVYSHIVGNGISYDELSNAHTLDWSGNAWYQGGIYVGGAVVTNEDGTLDYSGASEVATKADIVPIESSISSAQTKLDTIEEGAQVNVQPDWNENDETSAAYVKNRPFYTGNPVYTVIVDNVTFDAPDSYGMGIGFVQDPFALELVEGVEYTVTWNGTEYSTVCTVVDGVSAIGNVGILGMGDDSGEPFIIAAADGVAMVYATVVGTHTISITGIVAEIHKIDEKYLPDLPDGASIGIKGTGVGAEIFNSNVNVSSGQSSHAEGRYTEASGNYSHAEGENTTASGESSHAEGRYTEASGYCSHAEGGSTEASGNYSHAEGSDTTASGNCSHAEGGGTEASGYCSHAEGGGTSASSEYQHVQGKYNVEDIADIYAHVVGNGTSNTTRSNAHTIDWDGNAWYAGTIKLGGTSYADASEVALKSDFESIVAITNDEIDAIFASI